MTSTAWVLLVIGISVTAYYHYFRVRGMLYRPVWFGERAAEILNVARLGCVAAALILFAGASGVVLTGAAFLSFFAISWAVYAACIRREMRYQYARHWYSMKSRPDSDPPKQYKADDWLAILAASSVLENMGKGDPFNDAARQRILRLTGDALDYSYSQASDFRIIELREFWANEGISDEPSGPATTPSVVAN